MLGEIKHVQDPTSFKQIFGSMIPDNMNVVHGQVISEKPLEIKVVNDEKLILTEAIICLPRHLTDYETKVDIQLAGGSLNSETDEAETYRHKLLTYDIQQATMTVCNALKKGEIVYILSFNEGKKYYILDREEAKT